ncbi:MAG: HU family DNA-binding protein [Thermoflexales bacterium]|jgi:nucleoid DNA-binding protein|nr:HU family DNA-binding protein [Thermoflexales bacterium]
MAAKRLTKSEFIGAIAKESGLEKKQVVAALDAMNAVVIKQLSKAPGEVVLPGLLKLVTVKKPAVKARPGINPFTKEPTVFKAKPATKVVKARMVKALKDAVVK